MAANVFGIPITDETLMGMPKYRGKQITATDRAHEAMLMKNAESKDHNTRNHVIELKRGFGDGISALCMIYNATGGALEFSTHNDYHGHIEKDPYPQIIQNGQWAAFLHVKPFVKTAGSSGAVVYSGKNQFGIAWDWMLAWSIPYVGDNHAYTEVREADYYNEYDFWDRISENMGNSGLTHQDKMYECISYASIGNNTSRMYEGIMMLEGA